MDKGQRPTKRSRIQLEPDSAQSTSTFAGRRLSDPDSSDETLSQSSAPDNVLAPIRPSRAPHSWSLPSIHSTHDAYSVPHGPYRADEEATPRRSSTLSLSSLMNPCGCRSTGSCTTCSEQRRRRAPVSPKQLSSALNECDPVICSSSKSPQQHASPPASTSTQLESSKASTSSCCTGKGALTSAAPSIELLLRAVDMTTDFVPPPCACGQGCRCSRCLAKQRASSPVGRSDGPHSGHRASSTITSSSVSPRTPPATLAAQPTSSAPGCDDCAACDLALERPSGIGAVDSWMDKQRASPPRRRSPPIEVSPAQASVPTLHGGLVTSEAGLVDGVHAELVLVHPKCAACLEVVRSKGVGVLSSGLGAK
ncbi:hypothetical protein PSEUBRA_005198 [Kalmanozyma brasiliensis GHG001]|uniref:uncharacterized protein n=1 Tax=Kalmanozyma brasiliensis (strain GHG001) TaxID=1365824 RepID=UPI002867B7BC|nr:uncharacterized protein PSEUBRA_005198 [Kalmanozyma brasiliensis GHG001]KAF6767491.1 hypothetical protein PSEUBRA_005198 [Kalmanozyma brasiliensis GHG001]